MLALFLLSCINHSITSHGPFSCLESSLPGKYLSFSLGSWKIDVARALLHTCLIELVLDQHGLHASLPVHLLQENCFLSLGVLCPRPFLAWVSAESNCLALHAYAANFIFGHSHLGQPFGLCQHFLGERFHLLPSKAADTPLS